MKNHSESPCDCTEPYSQFVEGPGVSNVDAYGNALPGARSVFRCVHRYEMVWTGENWRTAPAPND